MENGLRLELGKVFALAHKLQSADKLIPASDVGKQLLDFFADRLKVHAARQGVRHDLVDAVFAVPASGEDDLVRLLARVEALAGFPRHRRRRQPAGGLPARRQHRPRSRRRRTPALTAMPRKRPCSELAEEKALFQSLAAAEKNAVPLLAAEDFAGCMGALAALRAPVDAFFDKVRSTPISPHYV